MIKFVGLKRSRIKKISTIFVRSLISAIIGAMCILLCAGCTAGPKNAGGNEKSAEKNAMIVCARTGVRKISEGKVEGTVEYAACTLEFAFVETAGKEQELKQQVKAFEEIYPGITIELSGRAADTWEEELTVQLQNSTAPDINQIEWEWLHEYSADGTLFYDLYKEHEVLQLGAIGQQYLNLCTVAEKLQALPAELSCKVFFFNEELFAKAGIDVPKSLEELMAAGEIFRMELGEEFYPLALTIEDRMELLVYYLQSVCGKDWVVDGVLQYYVEDIEKGMDFLLSLEEAHVIPTLQYARSDESLGRDAGWSGGVYGGVFVDLAAVDAFAELLPFGNDGVAAGRFYDLGTGRGGYLEVAKAYAVSENCANKREAALFLDFLINGNKKEEETESVDSVIAESEFYMSYEYACMIADDSLYSDVMVGLSYGDYNAREAAQLLLDSFSK